MEIKEKHIRDEGQEIKWLKSSCVGKHFVHCLLGRIDCHILLYFYSDVQLLHISMRGGQI